MNIIKPGKLKSAKLLKATCRECGCQFEFMASEAKYEPLDQRREGDFYRIKCPQVGCQTEVIVYPK